MTDSGRTTEATVSPTAGDRPGQQMARHVRHVARALALPALLLMLAGRLLYGNGETSGAGPATASLAALASPTTLLTPLGAMSAGLLLLALVPVVTVSWIMFESLSQRRWTEGLIAAGVLAVLLLSATLGF